MSKIENKIEANDRSILEVLDKKKYTVDYFQREYSWEQKHIEQLVTDLASAFLASYETAHERTEVENYNTYYLGPFVLSEKDGRRSIIDGQQRLTSLTLFMIYLHNLQASLGLSENIESMIFSERFGKKSFNITVEERVPCLQSLFDTGAYYPTNGDDASTRNMAERYEDIANAFPKEINARAFPYFIDWLKEQVVLVEIIAYSDDNAYTVFETMNDRGLNLTSTEMLKGYVLSRFKGNQERHSANDLWKRSMQELHQYDKDEDQRFFQAWLRGQYAETIRASKAGSTNEDFEKIGTRFHSWFRENLRLMNLTSESSSKFVEFIDKDFQFFHSVYLKIREAEQAFNPELEHLYYIPRWGFADSLRYPLLLAPLLPEDSPEIVEKKLNLVAKYIEIFAVRRSVNFRTFGASSIRYTMYSLVKEIRRKSVEELETVLTQEIAKMKETWDGMSSFRLHGQNGRFVKFLLSRISGYVDQQSGHTTDFVDYYENPNAKPFEIEHIWANKFAQHRDEFDQEHEFLECRNGIGDLVLLPKGTNQSYNDAPYAIKQPHYVKENLLVQSLHELTYQKNPNFVKMAQNLKLPFQAHPEFKKADIEARQKLYQVICERIWAFEDPVAVTEWKLS
ncbi:MAG: DUF262 domain-containing protein [Opitutae bacterium]|nr:DUF262 domain-containing protein [Opitutae bacterium]